MGTKNQSNRMFMQKIGCGISTWTSIVEQTPIKVRLNFELNIIYFLEYFESLKCMYNCNPLMVYL
jgi:hypothetical protein